MLRSRRLAVVSGIVCSAGIAGFFAPAATAQVVPAGFVDAPVAGGFDLPVGVAFAADGRAFVWEKGGHVWMIVNGVRTETPVIDLTEEVGNWRDHGMLGLALDPNFLNNGYVYLSYAVDYHHARYFGTPQYNPATDEYFRDTIGRVTRLQLNPLTGFTTQVAGSRLVLIGESLSTGIPLCHQSHGVGTLVFGSDGTLFVGSGDGGSYEEADNGGPRNGSSNTALTDGIITQAENIGAFRAQFIDSHSGKMLRIDPATGDGLASNPFYNPAAPRSPRSRVWAMGFRNPFRFTIRPGTGSVNPAAGSPGTLYIGDVGWYSYEELDVVTAPGQNFGWPLYEGMGPSIDYPPLLTANRNAPNPLAGGSCPAFFNFQNLLIQERLGTPSWPNPCNTGVQIAPGTPRFMHRRPAIDWGRNGPFRCGSFSGNTATVLNVGAPGAPVAGGGFNPGGTSTTGGAWYSGTRFPATYQSSYYHGEFNDGWIHQFRFNASDQPIEVRAFATGLAGLVDVEYNPADQSIYYINIYSGELRRISYGLNSPPVVSVTPTVAYGVLPLVVNFSTAGTIDPDGDGLTYAWDFGDGSPISTAANPTHTYLDSAPLGSPKRFDVVLTVTDALGNRTIRRLLVSGNNTPPVVQITSPIDGSLFGEGTFLQPLRAMVTDAEHSGAGLTCTWRAALYHNLHQHVEPLISGCAPDVLVDGVGHTGELFRWGFRLTVTDAAGLSTTAESFIFPAPADCNSNGVEDAQDIASGTSTDCDFNEIPDECDIATGYLTDCNANGVPDWCETTDRTRSTFSTSPAPFQLNGAAALVNQEIMLTPATNFLTGSAVLTTVDPAPMRRLDLTFDFTIGNGTGADGFSFAAMNAASHPVGIVFGEEGPGANALTVQFDTYDNGGEGENIIEIMYNGATLGRYTPTFDLEDGIRHRAEIFLRNSRLTVRVTDPDGRWETAFDRYPIPGFTPFVARYGFGARTGGLNHEHRIDNVTFAVPNNNDLNANRRPDSCECVADVDNGSNTGTPDGGTGIEDLLYYLALYSAGAISADIDDGTATGRVDGGVGIEDLLYYLVRYDSGC